MSAACPDRSGQARERRARAVLSRVAEPGNRRLFELVAEHGAEEVVQRLQAETGSGSPLRDLQARFVDADPEADLAAATKLGGRFLIPGDEEWPVTLDDLARVGGTAPPLGIWVRGPIRLDTMAGGVAIVGSRSSTSYGESLAFEIAADCARDGRVIVSGGAFGIDQAAHRGAIAAGGVSLAVLAGGVDRFYPRASAGLLNHMAQEGAVVSEVPPGCAPTRTRFLIRNRLIAALSVGTVVIEAAIRSGALNTVGWADQLNRVVMGLPGPVTSVQSSGVHRAIREQQATMITCGGDVLELVSPAGASMSTPPRAPERVEDALPIRDRRVLDALPVSRPAGVESIVRAAGLPAGEVASSLERLAGLGLAERRERGWRLART